MLTQKHHVLIYNFWFAKYQGTNCTMQYNHLKGIMVALCDFVIRGQHYIQCNSIMHAGSERLCKLLRNKIWNKVNSASQTCGRFNVIIILLVDIVLLKWSYDLSKTDWNDCRGKKKEASTGIKRAATWRSKGLCDSLLYWQTTSADLG